MYAAFVFRYSVHSIRLSMHGFIVWHTAHCIQFFIRSPRIFVHCTGVFFFYTVHCAQSTILCTLFYGNSKRLFVAFFLYTAHNFLNIVHDSSRGSLCSMTQDARVIIHEKLLLFTVQNYD